MDDDVKQIAFDIIVRRSKSLGLIETRKKRIGDCEGWRCLQLGTAVNASPPAYV